MYQTMSPESMPTSSIRKSNNHIKSSNNKEDQNTTLENGGMIITTITSVNSTVSSSQQKQQCQSEHLNQSHVSEPTMGRGQSLGGMSGGCGGGGSGVGGNGDVLLQWGQRKRSRCSRSEGRSMLEKSQTTNHIMPPVHPSTSSNSNSNGCRNGGGGGASRVRPNGLLLGKNVCGFSPSKNRNLGDQMGCSSSASPLRNGGAASGTQAISRSSVGKRSPSRIDKNDKKISSSGSIRKVKSDDPLPVPGSGSHTELAHGEQENGGITATMACSPVEGDKGTNNEVVEWPRIYLTLSRKEKEDDFYAMKGTKLPHRPKKRAKAVDRALQYCFPGLWLSDLTRARYEVRERKSTKKPKRRGLKGLENMESESE